VIEQVVARSGMDSKMAKLVIIHNNPEAITLSLFTTVDSREEGAEFEVTGFDLPTLEITVDLGIGFILDLSRLATTLNRLERFYQTRIYILLFMGGGMGAGKSTALKDILKEYVMKIIYQLHTSYR
ncbi:hypothetical protein Tco_1441891, partial [Tanacetum coccineum]